MKKLEKKRDELKPADLHWQCGDTKCVAHKSWVEGFNTAASEWQKIVEPLVKTLEEIAIPWEEGQSVAAYYESKAKQALANYKKEIA